MKALIIDDERLARKELANMLQQFPEVEIVGECANAEDALESIRNLHPDLIFLDIQMPGMNGFEMLQELDEVPRVVFVTAFDEFAIKAFEVNALDYLLKPVEEARLAGTIQKLHRTVLEAHSHSIANAEGLLGQDDQIFIKDGEKCWFVSLSEIRMFESEGNYVRVYFKNNKPLILKSLNMLETRLDRTFFRTNRKFIVNLKWVESVENWFNGGLRLTLREGGQVEVSRRQGAKFREVMSL
jgi:two-component system LytT family response regulator